MQTRLQSYVDDEDDCDEEVGGVVDGVVPEAGAQFAKECELAGLGEALHERQDDPGEQLAGPVDNSPQGEQCSFRQEGGRRWACCQF